jgi:hypothetical protein
MATEVRLAHFSVKECLVSERVQAGLATRYSIRGIRRNIFIPKICFPYLLQFDNPDSLVIQTIEEFPLAGYAAKYWTQHARAARKEVGGIHRLVVELFLSKRETYVNWIRLFDPDRPRKDIPNIMRSLNSVPLHCTYSCMKFRHPTAFTPKRVKGCLLQKNCRIYLGCNNNIILSGEISVAIGLWAYLQVMGVPHNYQILGIFSSHKCRGNFSQPLVYGHTFKS